MEQIAGFLAPVIIYAYIFLLNVLVPGRWVTGYATKTNSTEKLRYRLNGIQVLFIVVLTWALICHAGFLPWDWLYTYRWQGLAGAVIFGLIFSLVLVLPNTPVKGSFFADFYLGRLENPQLWSGRIDAKMWLYLVGAIMLQLNVLSFAMHHCLLYGTQSSTGILLSTGLLTFFLIDYLTFEEVHLYTYDLFAERVGFKLGWGCIAFYPYFYAIPQWSTAALPDTNTPTPLLIVYALIFFTGWSL